MSSNAEIKILLVDDIAETRESIKKLLAFESDFKVVGSASNGREGVEQTKELEPDIVIMDINMPDMDGLQAAALITKAVPTAGVIMMSVQDDPNYMQRAMLAGARFFLPKPVDMDQLYTTIRTVYDQMGYVRRQVEAMRNATPVDFGSLEDQPEKHGDRPGHIIAVYSPQGGAGCTTVATSLASGLMKEGLKVLLVDGDMEFGDVGAFLNLQPQSTISELVESIEDMDTEYFDNSVMTHDSGFKVLMGPPRPIIAAEIRADKPQAISDILKQVRHYYDFIVVDTASSLDEMTVGILDVADKIVILVTPTLPSIKNVRLVLDLFDQQLRYPLEKVSLIINKAADDRNRKKATIAPEKIQNFLKREIESIIPQVDERIILGSINRGIPVIASDRDTTKAPIKQLLAFSDHLHRYFMGDEEEDEAELAPAEGVKKSTGRFNLFGG